MTLPFAWLALVGLPFAAPCLAAPLEIDEPLQRLEERQLPPELLRDRLQAAALFSAGRVFEQRGDSTAALRKYQRAYRYDESPSLLREVLRLSAETERVEEAARYALLSSATAPLDANTLRPLALLLTQQGDWARALALYETMLASPSNTTPTATEAPLSFTDLTIRQEAIRLYFLTGRFAGGAPFCAALEAALAEPEKFRLNATQHKELLGDPHLTYHLFGECHLAAGDFAAARASFETAHKHQANAGLLGYNLARVEQRRGESTSALEHLQAYFTAKLAGEGAAPYALLGELLTALDKAGEFDDHLNELRAADPENASLLLFVAHRLLGMDKYELAEPLYARLAQTGKKRNAAEVYAGLLTCRQKLHQPEALLATLNETSAKSSAEIFDAALAAVAADEPLRAALIRLARDRRSPDAGKLPPAGEAWTICSLALAGHDTPTALEFFAFALQDQPQRRGELLEAFGVKLLLADEPNEAAKILRRGLEDESLAKRRAQFQYYLSGALALGDSLEEALSLARAAAAAQPNNPRYGVRVAWILQRAQRRADALAECLALLQQYDKHHEPAALRQTLREIRQTISNLHALLGNPVLSEEYLEQILDEFPDNPGALNDLGYLWAEAGKRLDRAKRMIERAVAAEPENRAYLDSLGWVEYRLGNYSAAQAALEKAIDGDTAPDPVMLDHLGDVYARLGQRDKARELWQRALDGLKRKPDEIQAVALEAKLRE